MGDFTRRIRYLAWAASRIPGKEDQRCPACKAETRLIRRKFLVAGLRECPRCALRFRTPKDDDAVTEYYQTSYSKDYPEHQPPSPASLAKLKQTRFFGDPEKDFHARGYIAVLKAVGLRPGDTILDFGSSWGYGSWQFREAGFRVYSYEVSKSRAEYARTMLGCEVIEDLSKIPERVHCLFSSHVIEHLSDPTVIWQAATQVLREDGVIVAFCPNGEPKREALLGSHQYDYLWPRVHPQVITPAFVRHVSEARGFSVQCFSDPYDMSAIEASMEPEQILGGELCAIARRLPVQRGVGAGSQRAG